MSSIRYIEKTYAKMLLQHKDLKFGNKVNVYECPNGHVIKTTEIDPGTSPMLLNCGECGQQAKSSGYKDTHPEMEVTYEFYRPDLKYVIKKLRKNAALRDHVLAGGLLLRKVQL